MTDKNGKNKQTFGDRDASQETKTFAPVGNGTDETKTFEPISDDEELAGNVSNETRQLVIDGGGKEPTEKCEERGSIKDYTVASVSWKILRPLLILVVSAALLIYCGVTAYHYIENSYFAPVEAESSISKTVDIKTGSSLSTIASKLFEEGIIRNKFVFQMYVDLNDMGSSLLAGNYVFSPSMTMDEIIKILGEGNGPREVFKVTFTEGMTVTDMADTLLNKEAFDKDERKKFLELCNDADKFKEYGFIEALQETANLDGRKYLLEGYLFPDTYEFYADVEPRDIIDRLLARFDEIFTLDYEEQAKEMNMSIDDVMTLASIIEWEALDQDFKEVSAVFHNRLDSEMTFDSCATMRYVTGEKKLVYTDEELDIDDKYNTYMYSGLPIGPIANPGKKAIESALYPNEEYMEEGYLFFCNKDPETGELAFAKSSKEHDKNVAMYEDLW